MIGRAVSGEKHLNQVLTDGWRMTLVHVLVAHIQPMVHVSYNDNTFTPLHQIYFTSMYKKLLTLCTSLFLSWSPFANSHWRVSISCPVFSFISFNFVSRPCTSVVKPSLRLRMSVTISFNTLYSPSFVIWKLDDIT